MSLQDAESVKRLLERAKEAAKPLKDNSLTKKIDDAADHVSKRIDPKKIE